MDPGGLQSMGSKESDTTKLLITIFFIQYAQYCLAPTSDE